MDLVGIPPALQEFIKQKNEVLAAGLDKAVGQMQEIDPVARVELDEFYFRAFVDFFAGEEKMMYFGEGAEARQKAMNVWTNTAGTLLHEVDVVRMVNGKKEILFTVPPILDRNLVEPVEQAKGRPSIYGAVLNAHHLSHRSHHESELYLREYLGERLGRMFHPEIMVKNAEAWNKIFAFYGRPPLVPIVAPEQAKKANDSAQDEIVGFDPL